MSENQYCGPFVVARASGLPTTQATALMRRASGRRAIYGAHWLEVMAAIAATVGVDAVEEYGRARKGRPRLTAWWQDRADDGGTWVVEISGHYIIVRRPPWSRAVHVFDTFNPAGIALARYDRRNSFVQRALRAAS